MRKIGVDHNISPPNRWTIRVKEPMGRTIPPSSDVSSPKRLDSMASLGYSSTQQPEELNYRIIAQSNNSRV